MSGQRGNPEPLEVQLVKIEVLGRCIAADAGQGPIARLYRYDAVSELCSTARSSDPELAVAAMRALVTGQSWRAVVGVLRDQLIWGSEVAFQNNLDVVRQAGDEQAAAALTRVMVPVLGMPATSRHILERYGWLEAALVSVGAPAVETLLLRLRRDFLLPLIVRWVRVLGGIGDLRAVEAIGQLASHPNLTVREASINALRGIAWSADTLSRDDELRVVRAVLPFLEDAHTSIRSQAAHTLRVLNWEPDSPATRILCALALDDDGTLRRDGAAVEPLIQLLSASRPHLRRRAAETLGRLGARQALTALNKRLGVFGELNPEVRAAVAQAIRDIEAATDATGGLPRATSADAVPEGRPRAGQDQPTTDTRPRAD